MSFSDIDMAPSGEFIIARDNSEIYFLDVRTGQTSHKINSLDTFGMSASQIFTNGDIIVVNGQIGHMVVRAFDRKFKKIWEYEDKDRQFNPARGAITLDGKNIISTYSYRTPDKKYMTIVYFFENNELKWKKEITEFVMDISISDNGDLIALKRSGETGVFLLDKNGNELKKLKRPLSKIKLSSDGKYAAGIMERADFDYKVVFFEIGNPENIWKFDYEGQAKTLDQTTDSKITVIGFGNFFYVLNDKGELVQKRDIDGIIGGVRISSEGKYIMVSKNNRIEVYSNEIPATISPKENAIIEGETPIFKWYDNGALSYILNIDSRSYNVQGNEFIFDGSLVQGEHTWSIKAVNENGEGMPSYPIKFSYYTDPIPHLIYPDDKKGFQTGNITLKWDYKSVAAKYLVDISGTQYKSGNKELTLSADAFQPGAYFWSVTAVGQDGKVSERSSSRTFYITAPEEKVIQKEVEVTSQINITYALAGGLVILGILMIFIRPFYKRMITKRRMIKTPTDWCPYPDCRKFTGGALICPHCKRNTSVKGKYPNLKIDKKL